MATLVLAFVIALGLLAWGADRFIAGAAITARYVGMPPLLVGMVVVGFGTSAPELVVSAIASAEGTPGVALGNAYGSNIANLGLVLGVAALVGPLPLRSGVVRREWLALVASTMLTVGVLLDSTLGRLDAGLLLATLVLVMGLSIRAGLRSRGDALGRQAEAEYDPHTMSRGTAMAWLVVGLVTLTLSSRVLVWAAATTARAFGVSDLLIGLTVVAVGTSLPELASMIAAVRRGETDIAIGNAIGSNLFNTLAVVGLSGLIWPGRVPTEMLTRDVAVMGILTLALLPLARLRGPEPGLGRLAGALLLASYVGYGAWLGGAIAAGAGDSGADVPAVGVPEVKAPDAGAP